MFRPVRTKPVRLRGERRLGQRGGFLVTKQRRRRPVLRKVSQRGGLLTALRKAYKKVPARVWRKPVGILPRRWRV